MIKGKNNTSITVEDIGDWAAYCFLVLMAYLIIRCLDIKTIFFLPRGYRVIGIDIRGFGDSDLVIQI